MCHAESVKHIGFWYIPTQIKSLMSENIAEYCASTAVTYESGIKLYIVMY